MKEMMLRALYAPVLALLLLAGGCKEKGTDPDPDPAATAALQRQARNLFAMVLLADSYRWEEQALQRIETQQLDYRTASDPFALFDGLLYQHDKWSELTDDYELMNSEFSGTSGTFGYSLQLWRYSNSESDIFAVVTFTYPDSPAREKGVERGDLIVGINGGSLTVDNYMELYTASTISLTMGVFDAQRGSIGASGETIALTARKMYQDPIQYHTVLTEHGRRIGYLCYTNYIWNSDPAVDAHGALLRVFQEFKDAAVQDVVLDLRYNGGGHAITAELLCDILAPRSALDNGEIMTVEQWNETYHPIYGGHTTFGHQVSYDNHTDQVVNMDLSRVYILTSGSTASASESTIVGLKPYMDVVLVGGTTAGKFCGGWLLDSSLYPSRIATENFGDKDVGRVWNGALDNWGAYVMVYDFTNKNGDTFENGFAPLPANAVSENLLSAAYPFGDTRDPLLGRALELITGQSYDTPDTRGAQADRLPVLPFEHAPAHPLDGRLIKRMGDSNGL